MPAWGDVTGKPAQSTRWPKFDEVTDKPSTFPPAAHDHDDDYAPIWAYTIDKNGKILKSRGGNVTVERIANGRYEVTLPSGYDWNDFATQAQPVYRDDEPISTGGTVRIKTEGRIAEMRVVNANGDAGDTGFGLVLVGGIR